MDKLDFAGIEVSADQLLVALWRDGQALRQHSFANTPAGHRELIRYLARPGRTVRVCVEATGLYGLDVALALQAQAGIAVMVANPRAVRHFAQALMQRSKTDPLDADTLREFAARMPFQPWQPPSLAARQLSAVARRLVSLIEQAAAEKNRRHAAALTRTTPLSVRRDLERSIKALERAQQRLAAEARKIIAGDPRLQQRCARMLRIRGLGESSTLQILAELALLPPDCDVRQVTAFAGLDPREHTSGSSIHKKVRISKAGNRYLRRALFMPALVAVQHEPHFRGFYHHLLERGKTKMQALVATMRKLLHALWGMLKHDQPFDAARVYRLPSDPPPAAGAAQVLASS